MSVEISSFWPLSYWNLYFLNTFLLKARLSLALSIEIPSFRPLSYGNLYFLNTFIEISACFFLFYWNPYFLFIYFSIEISSFWPLSYWNLYFLTFLWYLLFLTTFLLKSLLSEYFFNWNLCFLFTCLLKSPLSDHFPIEISTFSLVFYNSLWKAIFSKWQEGGSIRRRTFCYEKRFPLGEVNFIIFKGELYYEMRVPSGQGSFDLGETLSKYDKL